MTRRLPKKGLERLTAATLAQVRGGGILLPALSKAKSVASGSTMLEEITIAHEDLIRSQ